MPSQLRCHGHELTLRAPPSVSVHTVERAVGLMIMWSQSASSHQLMCVLTPGRRTAHGASVVEVNCSYTT
eukprot:1213815-Prymnesium_polylepis.1